MKKRSKFNLDFFHPTTGDMGQLLPIGIKEVLPGDTFNHSTTALIRLAPLMAPVMHPCHVMIHHWFVPFRLIWEDWENFITGGPQGISAPVYPTITAPAVGGFTVGSLADNLSAVPGVSSSVVSALPFRAYNFIWNECYRDEDLQTPLVNSTASGPDTTSNTTLQNVCWEKDYVTSSRLTEQKGNEVTVPLVGTAPVKSNAAVGSGYLSIRDGSNNPRPMRDGGAGLYMNNTAGDANNRMFVDGSGFQAPSVNLLRFSAAWQRVLESRSRGGSRYVEMLRSWGVASSDARLQRPEYLGGGKQTVQFSEVLGTANNDDTLLGQLGGHGISAVRSNNYQKFFEEHGFVISLMFVRPITIYANGLHKLWNRRTREEFWQPEMQHIGQQEVLNKEVNAGDTDPNGRFGFQDRFDEFRRSESYISGLMRTTMDGYTLARLITGDVALNASMVSCQPSKDIFAVPSEPGLIVLANHHLKARRLVAAVGTSYLK